MSSSSSSSSSSSTPHLLHDFKSLKIFSDGSTLRSPIPNNPSPIFDDGTSLWQDHPFLPHLDLHLRLYKPTTITTTNLPIILYFHAGAFIIGSRTWPNYHNCCLRLSSSLNSLVLSLDHRLAPEHPLPSALDDAVSALRYLQLHATSPPVHTTCWLSELADFSRVFIFGDSSGGTMAHHLAVKFAQSHAELAPVRVCGYILLAPFFAGSERNRSELECGEDTFYTLKMHEEVVGVLVPSGRVDESILNPFGSLERLVEMEAAMMVMVGRFDLLKERAVQYGRRLRELGKEKVEVVEFEDEGHGFFTLRPWGEAASELIRLVGKFMVNNGGGSGGSVMR